MKTIFFRRIMRDSVRMYFAPLTGALKGIRAEMRCADREVQRHRNAEFQHKTQQAQNL